jgi:hypothetical protein
MVQTTAQESAASMRWPDIDEIQDMAGVRQWLKQFQFEMEHKYRELRADDTKVFETEIPDLNTQIAAGITINFDVPLPSGLNFAKSGSDVTWDAGTIDFGGTTYNIASGSHTPAAQGGIYWDVTTGILAGEDTPSTQADRWFIATYDSSANVKETPAVVAFNAGYLQASTLNADDAIISGTLSAGTVIISGGTTLNNWRSGTSIAGGQIATGTVILSALNFVPLTSSGATTAVIATINASGEGIDITADRIAISGTTTFSAGYDPSDKVADVGGTYTSDSGANAKVEIFPDANTGIIAYTTGGSTKTFEVVVGGNDVGDVQLGDYGGAGGCLWDQSLTTFFVNGDVTCTDLTNGVIDNDAVTTDKILDGAISNNFAVISAGSGSTWSSSVFSNQQQLTFTPSGGRVLIIATLNINNTTGSGSNTGSIRLVRDTAGGDFDADTVKTVELRTSSHSQYTLVGIDHDPGHVSTQYSIVAKNTTTGALVTVNSEMTVVEFLR